MKKFFLSLIAMFAITAVASAANYEANDAAIDAAIESATEINVLSLGNDLGGSTFYVASEKNDAIALVLTFIVGGFGIHRHYMGTSSYMWALYTFTLGGIFGIVPLVDFIVEIIGLVDGSGLGEFYNNTKFFMWL